ncbi:uncharacterized protein DUF4232 [Streptomyces sp. SLBN-118]|uniref:DUF4232 domain-containing protein n=1 Tax=Streptomyces sp. SLBN-118 TaxID=2768454 RepID=UPI00114DC0DC|nr:DUF4232 domain-containing protein [Streptomyces sp. SLBN-118]TQK52656.1 uncharacterized protein DUF4232 [Streptomyces sp. SLBN-118]
MRNTVVAATALLAALSLTACQSSDDRADDGKKPDASAPATVSTGAPAVPTPAADNSKQPAGGAKQTPAGNGKGGGTGTGTGKGSGTSACIGENTKVTVSRVSRPINHLLLTMTNTGSRACNAYHAPLLRFDQDQAVTQIMDDSKPQAVVSLSPGESAYASILLSSADGSGQNGRTAKNLTIHFAPRDGSGSTDTAPDMLKLPAGTYLDNNASVSYWQSSMSDALAY